MVKNSNEPENGLPREILILIVDEIVSVSEKREQIYARNASIFALGSLALLGLTLYTIFGLPDSQGKPIEIVASIVGFLACGAESKRYSVLVESEKTQRHGTLLWKDTL